MDTCANAEMVINILNLEFDNFVAIYQMHHVKDQLETRA